MLTIEHYVAPSQIHGLGVFCKSRVYRGSPVWEFNSIIDKIISKLSLATLPLHTVNQIRTHAEFLPDINCYILAADGDYYMNHADEPSLIDHGKLMFAARDLKVGEELTCDYRIVHVDAFNPDQARLMKDILVCEETLYNQVNVRSVG